MKLSFYLAILGLGSWFVPTAWATAVGECQAPARVLLSSTPSQGKFLAADFFFNLFGELKEVVYTNRATITNMEVNDMLGGWSEAGRNPRVADVFEVGNAFGTSVANLLDYAGNLKNHIDLSGIVMDKPSLSGEQRKFIFKRVHSHLFGLIEKTLHERHLSLDDLANQTGMPPKLFHGIVVGMKLPRAPLLLAILAKLDADPVDFFKGVENSLREVPHRPLRANEKAHYAQWVKKSIKRREVDRLDAISFQLKEIFDQLDLTDFDSDATHFKRALISRYYHRSLAENSKRRRLTLRKVFQTARMLGMRPSQVLKHARSLKSYAVMEGIESRTLLPEERLDELSKLVHQHFILYLNESKMGLSEISLKSEVPFDYLRSIIQGKKLISYQCMEQILSIWDSTAFDFLEKLELEKVLDVHAPVASHVLEIQTDEAGQKAQDTAFMGGRILKIQEVLAPFSSSNRLQKLITKNMNTQTRTFLTERDVSFETVYKASRVGNISLSDLVSDRPIETLLEPHRANLEMVPQQEIARARQLLARLLLNEAMRQKISRGINLAGLAIKAHLYTGTVKNNLSGKKTPHYLSLRRLVEEGLGIPLPRFLKNFEDKLEALDGVPLFSGKVLAELDGPYLSERVQANLERVKQRFEELQKLLSTLKMKKSLNRATGVSFSEQYPGYRQIYTAVKISRFLGISLQDFLSEKGLAQLVNRDRINVEHMTDDGLRRAINVVKANFKQRRERLGIRDQDMEIMLGVLEKNHLAPLFSIGTGMSFPWYRYFQMAEILTREGEDDLFFLEGVVF